MTRITFSSAVFFLGMIGYISVAGAQPVATIQTAYVITNCSGTQVIRTAAGQFEVRYVESNLPGCIRSTSTGITASGSNDTIQPAVTSIASHAVHTGDTLLVENLIEDDLYEENESSIDETPREVTNCNGIRVTPLENGAYSLSQVEKNLPGCVLTDSEGNVISGNGPLLDLTSRDIVGYRVNKLKEAGVRFAHVIRSVRVRERATRASRTIAIRQDNQAMVVDQDNPGWTRVTPAELVVSDKDANEMEAVITGPTGYMGSQYVRHALPSDLVRIEQADHAYWSNLGTINVRYANIRSRAHHTAPIVITLGKGYELYVIARLDNWSEVRNDTGTVRGYIRSDLLDIIRHGSEEVPQYSSLELNEEIPERVDTVDDSWIGF